MTGRDRVLVDGVWVEVDVPVSGGENVVLPVVRVIVRREGFPVARAPVLVQRRDQAGEPVRGRLEIPGGRWRSGEPPDACAIREVAEETGIEVSMVEGVLVDRTHGDGATAIVRPLVVVAGIEGRFPAVHTVLTAVGDGNPVSEAGATREVAWWSIDDLRSALVDDPRAFIPSSHAALTTYVEAIDSGFWS